LPSKRSIKKDPSLFDDAKAEMKRLTKGTKKGTYIDPTHGPLLLKMLDANALIKSFPDEFGKLIQILK